MPEESKEATPEWTWNLIMSKFPPDVREKANYMLDHGATPEQLFPATFLRQNGVPEEVSRLVMEAAYWAWSQRHPEATN
jgi:hypothetical protein